MKSIEDRVDEEYGVKIDELAIALMIGNYRVTEFEQSLNGGFRETRISFLVNGAEVEIELGKRWYY